MPILKSRQHLERLRYNCVVTEHMYRNLAEDCADPDIRRELEKLSLHAGVVKEYFDSLIHEVSS